MKLHQSGVPAIQTCFATLEGIGRTRSWRLSNVHDVQEGIVPSSEECVRLSESFLYLARPMSEHETTRAMLEAAIRAMSIHRYVLRAVRLSSPPSSSGDSSGTGPILQPPSINRSRPFSPAVLLTALLLAFAILFFVSMCFSK
jgi:hypothetical protein